jgi:hypothetical protein
MGSTFHATDLTAARHHRFVLFIDERWTESTVATVQRGKPSRRHVL